MVERSDRVVGDFELTFAELRVVTAYVLQHAEDVIEVFRRAVPDDQRPDDAVAAAREFVAGAPRSRRQRLAAPAAHRAAAAAPTEVARLAARCAADAAAAAYLHPLAQASQVGHILRAPATAARVAELLAAHGPDGSDGQAAAAALTLSGERATPVLREVLRRYPPVTRSGSRIGVLTSTLDTLLREGA